jgi:hypothetical protein
MNNALINQALIHNLTNFIQSAKIDVAIFDPVVSIHRVNENDNMAIDAVVKTVADVADRTNCAIELIHHTRKNNGAEATVEDGRGASAFISGVRSARLLQAMTTAEAGKAGVPLEQHWRHVRLTNGKSNMAPRADKSDWFHHVSVNLGNGDGLEPDDMVGVIKPWKYPDPLAAFDDQSKACVLAAIGDKTWRAHPTAGQWIGKPIAQALEFAHDDPRHKERLKAFIRALTQEGYLEEYEDKDCNRKNRTYIRATGKPPASAAV